MPDNVDSKQPANYRNADLIDVPDVIPELSCTIIML